MRIEMKFHMNKKSKYNKIRITQTILMIYVKKNPKKFVDNTFRFSTARHAIFIIILRCSYKNIFCFSPYLYITLVNFNNKHQKYHTNFILQ